MTEIVIENHETVYTIETATPTATTVNNVVGTATVVEVPASSATEVASITTGTTTVEAPAQTTYEIETTEGATWIVETTTGPTGHAPVLHSGAAPPSEAVGVVGDLYLVNTGATMGDLYQKSLAGWGVSKGNLRGGVASVNGISGTNIIIGANHITTGVLPIAQVPTGTTASTVSLGNHLHTGTYEPVIAGGLNTQFLRGDKTWQVIDRTSLGVNNVDNTSDANKPVSTATQAALNLKANIASPTFTGTVTVSSAANNAIEIGRTDGVASTPVIDFHSGAVHSDFDTRLIATGGNGGLAGGDLTLHTTNFIVNATLTANTLLSSNILANGAAALKLKPAADDYAYMGLYARTASPGTLSGYMGYANPGTTALSLVNNITNGGLYLAGNGTGPIFLDAIRVEVATALTTPALRVGTSATAGYVLTADTSGNATWQQAANVIVPGNTAQYYRGDLTWQNLNSVTVDLTTAQTISGNKTFGSPMAAQAGLTVTGNATVSGVISGNGAGLTNLPESADLMRGRGTGAHLPISGNWSAAPYSTTAGIYTILFDTTWSVSSPGSVFPDLYRWGVLVVHRDENRVVQTYYPHNNVQITRRIKFNDSDWSAWRAWIDHDDYRLSDARTPLAHTHTSVYEPVLAAGTTSQYYRGDKVWTALNATAVGLGNVANTVQVDLTSGQTITGVKVFNNPSNIFHGDGNNLTRLDAANLFMGTVSQSRLVHNIRRFVFTTGSEARPTGATYVEWVGPVLPTNAINDDTWTDTSVATFETAGVSMPVGIVQMYTGTGAPTNWMKCDGTAINRSTYSALFAIIGTQYGIGDGTTTFNLPNFAGRMPLGNDGTYAMGATGGAATHTLTTAEMPAHQHTVYGYSGLDDSNFTGNDGRFQGADASTAFDQLTSGTGGGGAHNNMPPYLAINFIIKVV